MALLKCPDCENDVSSLASACPKCGRPISSTPSSRAEGNAEGNSGIAFVLSVLVPGAGQIYKRRIASGLTWFFAVGLLYGIGFFHINFFLIAAIAHVACALFATAKVSPASAVTLPRRPARLATRPVVPGYSSESRETADMQELGIEFDGKNFLVGGAKFDKLRHAVVYARGLSE